MEQRIHFINERSKIIPINQSFITNVSEGSYSPKGEYSLKQNYFDPSKSSPPNNFMEKLQKRMSIYNSNKSYY